jgi:hypothetical protein
MSESHQHHGRWVEVRNAFEPPGSSAVSLGGDYVAWTEIFLACALLSLGLIAIAVLAMYVAKFWMDLDAALKDALSWDTAPTLSAGSLCLIIGGCMHVRVCVRMYVYIYMKLESLV